MRVFVGLSDAGMYFATEVPMIERNERAERESERRLNEAEALLGKEREERAHEADQYNLPFTD